MKLRQITIIALVLAIGAVATLRILDSRSGPASDSAHDNHEHAHGTHATRAGDTAETPRGPHGGRLFVDGDFALEVTIFETGVPPEFRFFATRNGTPLPPTQFEAEVTLRRLGQAPQTIRFEPVQDYLRGLAEIVEPHSFAVDIRVSHDGRTRTFAWEQEEARVRMSDEEVQRAGIEVLTAGPRRIAETLTLAGEIQTNRDRLAHVVSPIDGIAVSVHANAGDRVERGQVLAVIASQALAQLRSARAAADARVALTAQTAAREERLWREGISPEQDFRRAETDHRLALIEAASAREQLEALGLPTSAPGKPAQFELRALGAGTVIDKHLAIGESVSPGTPVFTVADLSTVWAEAKVGARELARVATGQRATVDAAAQQLSATGNVSYVSALLGENDRAVTVRVVLSNPDRRWRPGLPVSLTLETGAREVAVAVARTGLQTLRDWQVVFGRYDGFFEARPLKLGVADEEWIEVVEGLRDGERYAGANSYVIKADIGKAGASHDH